MQVLMCLLKISILISLYFSLRQWARMVFADTWLRGFSVEGRTHNFTHKYLFPWRETRMTYTLVNQWVFVCLASLRFLGFNFTIYYRGFFSIIVLCGVWLKPFLSDGFTLCFWVMLGILNIFSPPFSVW